MPTPRRPLRLAAAALALTLIAGACGADSDDADSADTTTADDTTSSSDTTSVDESTTSTHDGMDDADAELTAVVLRTDLNLLLQEHTFLAGAAVNEALQGDDAAFDAAVAALDENSVAIAGAIGVIYGAEAEDTFLTLWRSHIDMFVDYTTAVAAGDQAAADEAVAALTAYAESFAAFIADATGADPAVVEELFLEHVTTVKAAVDALASGDAQAGFTALREAMAHMPMIADPLAAAITASSPEVVTGDPAAAEGDAATLERDLNLLLAEHAFLAGAAAREAARGNTPAFEAAAAALDANSTDLATAMGGIYGAEAGDTFLTLWRSHIDMFVDYTTATIAGDEAAADEAVEQLTAYAESFAAFLADATGIDAAAVEELFLEHVVTLTAAIDAVAAGEENPYLVLQEAAHHMAMVATPLAQAIASQQDLS